MFSIIRVIHTEAWYKPDNLSEGINSEDPLFIPYGVANNRAKHTKTITIRVLIQWEKELTATQCDILLLTKNHSAWIIFPPGALLPILL